ncbi:Uncharacterised protein [Mycobacterium tuberculosis]|nr:Uncharacterised protein [Mycobacterium tuberculosis]
MSSSGRIRSRIANFIHVVTTPGAISRSMVSSAMATMVASSPEVVCTRSPGCNESCRSMVACMARRWRRDAKYMNPPMMSRNGKNKTKLSINPSFVLVLRSRCQAYPRAAHLVTVQCARPVWQAGNIGQQIGFTSDVNRRAG